jgi:hypothetical protein
MRTNDPLQRIMKEIRRRTRLVGAFPDGQFVRVPSSKREPQAFPVRRPPRSTVHRPDLSVSQQNQGYAQFRAALLRRLTDTLCYAARNGQTRA